MLFYFLYLRSKNSGADTQHIDRVCACAEIRGQAAILAPWAYWGDVLSSARGGGVVCGAWPVGRTHKAIMGTGRRAYERLNDYRTRGELANLADCHSAPRLLIAAEGFL